MKYLVIVSLLLTSIASFADNGCYITVTTVDGEEYSSAKYLDYHLAPFNNNLSECLEVVNMHIPKLVNREAYKKIIGPSAIQKEWASVRVEYDSRNDFQESYTLELTPETAKIYKEMQNY